MAEVILNEQQEKAKNEILEWYNDRRPDNQIYVLAGYAGTGKTFLVKYVIEDIIGLKENQVVFATFTGKAASVLSQRGVKNTSTIHRLIYRRVETEYETVVNGKKIKSKKIDFIKEPSIPNYKLIVVDEVSMVSEKILTDLLSYGIPLLCCGDLGQLPSIEKGHTLLEKPNINLTQIVRQEEGNSIIKLATMARKGMVIPTGDYGNCLVLNKNEITEDYLKYLLMDADQIIAGTNKTCSLINKKMRDFIGYKGNKLNIGEKIICLCNDWDVDLKRDSGEESGYALVNGTIGFVEDTEIVNEEECIGKLSLKPDFLDNITDGILYDSSIFEKGEFLRQFHQEVYIFENNEYGIKLPFFGKQSRETDEEYKERLAKYISDKKRAVDTAKLNFFNYAYCISCHKSQRL